jgi:O-acetyl-ADP-ribose deacetylase (regulator of RNase III)
MFEALAEHAGAASAPQVVRFVLFGREAAEAFKRLLRESETREGV